MRDSAFHRLLKRGELAIRRGIIAILNRRKQQRISSFPLPLSEAPTILFLRQDRYGDAIVSTPVMAALAAKFPQATFLILLGNNNKDISPLLPIECRTYVYRKKLFRDINMLRELRRKKIDVLVDMTDNASATSSIIAAMVSATFTIGIEKENAESYNVLVKRLDQGKYHVARRIAELLRPFGIDPESISLRPVLANSGIEKVPGRIGFNIAGREPSRYLPAELVARISNALSHDEACRELWLFGSPDQSDVLAHILSLTESKKVTAAPVSSRSFPEFANLLATCEYILSPDTAAVHLGSAFATPMVVFFNYWPPTLHYWTPIEVPYESIVKQSIHTLTVEEVLQLFRSLLAKVHRYQEVEAA